MLLIYLILLLVIIIILLLTIALKINLIFDTENENYRLTMLWLYPFIKAEVLIEHNTPTLEVFLFKRKVYKKAIKAKEKKNSSNGMQMMKDIKFDDISITASYGFKDKFICGIVCGLIHFASQFIQIDHLDQLPDFAADYDFIYLNATAKVDILPTLKNLATSKI